MRSLVWKQWRESRLLLILFSAWMVLSVAYTILYELGHGYRAVVGSYSGSAMLYTLVASIVLAVRVSQGEQSEGTLSFTASLPIAIRRIATVRIAAAVLTLAIPALVGASILAVALATGLVVQVEPRSTVFYEQLPNRATASFFASFEQLGSVTAIAILGGVELMLLLCLCGSWLRSQAQVGFLGAVMALGSIIMSGVLWYGERNSVAQLAYGVVVPQSLVIHWSYGDQTGGYQDHELATYRWIAMLLAIPVLVGLARLFVNRYGLRSKRKSDEGQRGYRMTLPVVTASWLVRFPNRLMAMIWLELRQSVPLVAFGLMFAILVSILGVLTESRHGHGFATSFRMELPHSVFIVGMLWSAVVGSGLYSHDLDLKQGAFWRSRPISPALWFWCKFFLGFVAVLVVLDGLTILVCWTAPRESMTTGMSWSYVGCLPIIHGLMYSLAVLGTCVFRRAVIGGVLAVVFFFVVTALVTAFPAAMHLEPVNVYNELLVSERAGTIDFYQHGYPLVYGMLAVMAAVSAILASWFARPMQSRMASVRSYATATPVRTAEAS